MRPSAAGRLAALLLPALSACAGRPAPPITLEVPGVGADATAARAVVASFIALEAAGSRHADTLLAPAADFVATGLLVSGRPRLAGMNGPGQGTVDESRTELAGNTAWVVVVYTFTGRTPELNERARGTFVLERQRAGWRIRHAHTSYVERW